MTLTQALASLVKLQLPVLRTRDAAACLNLNRNHASKILNRLRDHGFLISLAKGLWAFSPLEEPLLLPEYLTAPHPSYISLQTALYHHEMIEQIPQVIYAVSLSRSKRYETPVGIFSIHHVDPAFFFGFESIGKYNLKMAVPEKALLDVLYLRANKTRLFAKLPEWETPEGFSWEACRKMAARIPGARQRTIVLTGLDNLRRASLR